MRTISRTFAVVCVFICTSIAWLVLGSVMSHRTSEQKHNLEARVNDLWGRPHVQQAPTFVLDSGVAGSVSEPAAKAPAWEPSPGVRSDAPVAAPVAITPTLQPSSTRIDVDLALDQRLKGLTWYSLYDVAFAGSWRYRHESDEASTLVVTFAFPDQNGVYDEFRFLVNGEPVEATPSGGSVTTRIDVEPGDEVTVDAGYKSRGLNEWRYAPTSGAGSLKDFKLTMNTNFDDIDFPGSTMSPSRKEDTDQGHMLTWDFSQVVSGYGIGMVMPQRIQPGELASELSYSAPISLLFFFLVIAVLAKLRGLDIHPINYFFLGSTFFAFHLLFSYSVDHLPIWAAFLIASATSVAMVTTYLRLVVSPRFAFLQAGTAQLVYLIGFSLAHFASGFTGLTVTVLSIATLFLLMLLTGRVRWTDVLGRVAPDPRTQQHYATYPQPPGAPAGFAQYPVGNASGFPAPPPAAGG